MRTITLRLDDETQQYLATLQNLFGSDRSTAIRRAIKNAAKNETDHNPETLTAIEAKIDNIAVCLGDLLRTEIRQAETTIKAIEDTRIWSQRSTFFSRSLSEKFDTRQRAIDLMQEQKEKEQ